MNSKLLSILTSPFWGPKKLDEIHAAAEKNLETADKLSNDTAENLKKTEELYLQIAAFQEQQKNLSDAQKEQISQSMETLKSLMEMLKLSAAGLDDDRKTAKELQEKCEKTLQQASEMIHSSEQYTSQAEALLQKNLTLSEQITTIKSGVESDIKEFVENSEKLLQNITENQQKVQDLTERSQEALKENIQIKSNVADILSEIKKTSELDRQNINDAKQQVISNNQTVQALINSANNIISGLKSDREELQKLQSFSEKTLDHAEKILQESEENKKQAELILQEAAEKQNQALLIGEQQKKRAAMALNLCTTSISNIIACGNVEAMEREYNSILNNINLQAIVKDETLLETMRKILDTITFFRIQDKERKRLEARHQQRMNNLLWDSLSSAGGLFVVSGNPWAIAAAAAIQAGSMFVGYQKKKHAANMKLDDELWNLERSAIEQLHALRASLFETAWRLSDSYNFNDEWRLTVRQIEWFNEIRSEINHIIRYKKLEQYKDDFEAYPYYWYELGVAAQGAAEEERLSYKNSCNQTLQKKAETYFAKFIELDSSLNLLRQDVIGADARLRHVSLLAQDKGWAQAVKQDEEFLQNVKRLAVDDPELLLKAALVYASAYRECSDSKFAEQAIVFFEMLVMRGNNLPMTSIFLSELYLLTGQKNKYQELKSFANQQDDSKFILVPDTGSESEKYSILNKEYSAGFQKQCLSLAEMFIKDFEIIQKTAQPEIFNVPCDKQKEALFSWIERSFESGQNNFKQDLFSVWESEKNCLNEHLAFAEKSLGLNHEELKKIATDLNNQSFMKIASLANDRLWIKSSRNKYDKCMELLIAMNDWQNTIKQLFVEQILNLISNRNIANYNGLQPDDINALLAFHQESVISRNQLFGFSSSVETALDSVVDYFASQNDSNNSDSTTANTRQEIPDGCKIYYEDFDAAKIAYLYKNCYSYTIICKGSSKENYKVIEKVIKSYYPDKRTSWRDERHWYGWDWFRAAKAGICGAQDFEITFYDDKIEILYTKAKADEGTRDVKLLSFQAVEREYKRLLTNDEYSQENSTRLHEVTLRWILIKFEEIKSEDDADKQNKMRKELAKEIRKRCKDSKAADIFKYVLQEEADTYRIDSERQKILPMLEDK